MADSINIILPQDYEAPTEDDISKAKRWTLLRNENAARLSSLIESRLQNAIRELTKIGYKYNCKPEDFQFSQDENLREEVADIMNNLEDDIMELVEEYSLNESDDEERRNNLLPWLLALHSKNTDSLSETLHERLTQFLFDTEAQIAAMKLSKYSQSKAITRCLSTMHSVYIAPEVIAAFKKKSAVRYLKTRGVHEGNQGLSSSGAVNVENFGEMTAQMTWMQSLRYNYIEEGVAGFYVLRGSNYPCDICDSHVGFHKIEETEHFPLFHGHCCCVAIPIFLTTKN